MSSLFQDGRATENANGQVRIVYPGRRSRVAARITVGIFFIALSLLGFTAGLPFPPASTNNSSSVKSGYSSASSLGDIHGQLPEAVGADPLSPVHIPHTIVSSVDNLIGAGGVVQTSPDNLTIYNPSIRMRLLSGASPRDVLLGPASQVLSASAFWMVQVNLGAVWTPLAVQSSNLTALGTNATGTFVRRTMTVGLGAYRGVFNVTYKALSRGPLKWDLEFSPTVSAPYRFQFSWTSLTNSVTLASSLRQFSARFGTANYTFSWGDVPDPFVSIPNVASQGFELGIDLGLVSSGSRIRIDPSLVSTSTSPNATGNTFQRKVFFDPKEGYYFVFYNDGSLNWYRSSRDGVSWSAPQWGMNDLLQHSQTLTIVTVGETVVLVDAMATVCVPCHWGIYYYVGNMTGSSISWGSLNTSVLLSYCSGVVGCHDWIQDVSAAVAANGKIVISFNYIRDVVQTSHQCSSILYVWYSGPPLRNVTSSGRCFGSPNFEDEMRSVVVPSDPQGQVRLVYQKAIPSGSGWTKALGSTWLSSTTNGTFDLLDNNVSNSTDFSAVSTPDYRVQVAWKTLPAGTVSYAYRGVSDASWTLFKNVLSGAVSFPTLTADYSTNNVYAFASNSTSILMRKKTLSGNWTDSSVVSQVNQQLNPTNLGSNFASASSTNSSMILLVWTTGPISGVYSVTFAAVPVQTVWSPYSDPSDPWNGAGIAPYGQYFTNLGESVSPSTGLLSISQADYSVPGRGLDLSVTRVYTEPVGFQNGQPYNYENYPWAPMGNGWQLNFPWMNNVTTPQYIHLWNGEGYRIPANFWTIRGTGTQHNQFENHQGEDFVLSNTWYDQVLIATDLTAKSGTTYHFDANHKILNYADTYGNTISFSYYSNNTIGRITDTVGRWFNFQYNAGFVTRIWEQNPAGLLAINWVNYSYNGQTLASAMDALGRTTSYEYNAVSDSAARYWLISRVTYPTQSYTNYTYASSLLGTEVSTFRVSRQFAGFGSGSGTPMRQFLYSYTQGAGDQIVSSLVTTYNGTQQVSFTNYSFSFMIVAWNISDSSHNLVRGVVQQFGMHGEPERETVIVSDRAGGSDPPGSYTNYYRYDLWGNLIYSRKVINPSTHQFHESYTAYYNDGLQQGFNDFQDTFNQNQGTATDNVWNVRNGAWLVQNGQYNGTETPGEQADMIASADVGRANISIQATVYIGRQLNTTQGANPRVGIFAHYNSTSTKSYKWALVLTNTNSRPYLELVDEWNQFPINDYAATASCQIMQGWYTFSMWILGNFVSGNAYRQGDPSGCHVQGTFPSSSPAASGTGFGLYAGGYSALFDNVAVAPLVPSSVDPSSPANEFHNWFYLSGTPQNSVHVASAGSAEPQNGPSSPPIETYYNYTYQGNVNQIRQLYSSGGSTNSLYTSESYDSNGRLVKLIDPPGNYTAYGYSSPPNTNYQFGYPYLTSQNSTLLPGNILLSTRYNYNFSSGEMTSKTDPMGYTTGYNYDIIGRITRTVYATGDYTAYAYNDAGNYVDSTNENGLKIRQLYDGLGRLSTTERFLNGIPYTNQTSTYNWQDEASSTRDGMGNVTYYSYDSLGRLVNTAYADGTSISRYYNDTGSWTLTKNQSGANSCRISDRFGRLLSVIEASDSHCHPILLAGNSYVTNYYYDESGNLRQLAASNNQGTTYTYDNLNRLIGTSYPDGTGEAYTYDNNGNAIARIDRKGVTTKFSYDSLNRLLTATALGAPTTVTSYTYDSNGNPTLIQNVNATILYTYDSRNRVTSETYSVNGYFTLSVNPSSVYFFCVPTNCSPTTSNANVTVSSINGFSGTIALSYNPPSSGSNQTSITGPSSTFLPSGGKAVVPVTAWMGTRSGTFPWTIRGQSGNFTALAVYTISEYVCSRNPCPQSPTESSPPASPSSPSGPAGASYIVRYSRSGELLSNITYPDNTVLHYAYDGLGRTISASTIVGPVITTYVNFAYNRNDQVTSIAYNSGLQASYSYDSVGRTSSITVVMPGKKPVTLLSLSYQYNKTSTVASVTGSVNSLQVNEQYSYDTLNRLSNAIVTSNAATTASSYQLDTIGNRLSQTVNSQTTSYTYNVTNSELKSSTGTAGVTSYSYDAYGNLASKTFGSTAWTFTWDLAGKLLKANKNGATQGAYAYDSQGRRVESLESSTTFYAYLGSETLYEYNATSKTSNDYIYAAGVLVGKLSAGTISFYHGDAVGSTRLVTSSSGNVLFTDGYQPYGQDNGTPSATETYRFTGKPVSQTTSLYYEYQRWYDPTIGRFVSQDPLTGSLSDPQSQNRYVYVRNLPTSLVDPSGQEYRSDCVGGAYVCEGGVGSPGADTSQNMSDIFRQRICGQNPWICGLTGLGVGGIGLGTTADWVCGQNPLYCYSPRPNPDGTTRSPGGGEVVNPSARTITVYPGTIRIPVTTNPSVPLGSTYTNFRSDLGEIGRNGDLTSLGKFTPIPLTNIPVKGIRAIVCLGLGLAVAGAAILVTQPGSVEQRGFAYQRTPPPELVSASFLGTFLTCAVVTR